MINHKTSVGLLTAYVTQSLYNTLYIIPELYPSYIHLFYSNPTTRQSVLQRGFYQFLPEESEGQYFYQNTLLFQMAPVDK